MESEKIYNIEFQIKKVLEALIKQFIVSKEKVTVIDFTEITQEIKPTKEHLEIDLQLLENKIKKEYNSFKSIIEKLSNSKIKDFQIDDKCYTNNFSDINSLINSIYNCQFKKTVDNLRIVQEEKKKPFNLLTFLKDYIKTHKSILLIVVVIIILLLIGRKYYKK
jgi:hypothetical protein